MFSPNFLMHRPLVTFVSEKHPRQMSPVTPAIAVSNLSLHFNGLVVFDRLNIDVLPGEKLAVTGPSGSGKSSFLHCLLGFLDFRGDIHMLGRNLTDDPDELRRLTSWLPQELSLARQRVDDLFMLPFRFRRNQGLLPERAKVNGMLERLGLEPGILTRKTAEISGGQKQRVVLASVLLLGKPLLFLDEPVSALDEVAAGKVMDLVFALDGITVVASTHNSAWADRSDRVLDLGK
jgi:ABC-type multidrug transport system ATPase subunit